ncbi:hypothetical protein [Stappia indica]|uniref:hypothetical protein n=1 Tax=Stappia indica TaxID=538381 RepID=UPI001CD3A7B0|nr:hypothetical protein [Stappia indica]MCA1298003.1 hypothetical protein [Stappia indica]
MTNAQALRNITPFDEIVLKIDELYDEAKNWADGEPIQNQQQHDAVEKIRDAIHEAGKKADEMRKEEKRPLDEQVKAIQDRYNPLIQPKKGKVDRAKSALGDVLAVWRDKLADEARAKAEAARIEAEEKRRAAEEAMRSSAGDLEAREEAEEILSAAKNAEKQAKRADKAATTGTGLRTYYRAEIEDLTAVLRHYWPIRRAELEEFALGLANADVRAGKRDIPGVRVIEEKRAV